MHIASGPNERFLEQCGILSRPIYTNNGNIAQGLLRGQIDAFRDLDSKEPGLWALAQGENSLMVSDKVLIPDQGVGLELLNAIPVPDRDVPLNEILEFRLKRSDELEHLRTEIDESAERVKKAADREAELRSRLEAIDKACADAIRVSHEWQFPMRLANVKLSFDIRPILVIGGGAAAYEAAIQLGMSATAAAINGAGGAAIAAGSALKFGGDFGWRGLKRKLGAYRYVYEFHTKLF